MNKKPKEYFVYTHQFTTARKVEGMGPIWYNDDDDPKGELMGQPART